MSPNRVAIGFSNCLGNFILMTAALKILRERNDDEIYLITDEDALYKHPAVKAMAEKLFDGIYTTYRKKSFNRIYVGNWSCPECMVAAKDAHRGPVWWINHSTYAGMHEVQIYLNMINASNSDFSGFLTSLADGPILDCKKPRVVFANSSNRVGSRKGGRTGWGHFPELSEALLNLGYEVILVGQGDELKGCIGIDYVDKLDIFETSKVISQCDLMISVDTGLMHIADSLGIPIVLLAGPTPMTKAHPLVSSYHIVRKFISCAPCYQSLLWHDCNESICMDSITVGGVLKKVFSLPLETKNILRTKLTPFINVALSISSKMRKSLKIVMPYYAGVQRIEDAVRSWPKDILVLAITDEGTKAPDGYESFFTPENAKVRGLSDKTKPLTKDLYDKLLRLYPNEAYYGYINSDIILPPNTNVQSLLPGYDYQTAVHHRLDVKDSTNSGNSTTAYRAGKDCFIWSAEVFKKVASDYPVLVIGACNWDDGLVHWIWREFGKDSIDVRYCEVWHVTHPAGWTGEDKDGHYNGATLDSIGITTLLRCQFLWKDTHLNWEQRKNKIGIIQPGRIGDIAIVLPIAKWYADQGYEVTWPIYDPYLPLFEHVNYVKSVGTGVSLGASYEKAIEIVKGKVGRVINLGIGFGRDETDWIESELTFDQWKYEEAGVPFSEKHNLQITKLRDKEDALRKKLNLPDDYIITHSKGDVGDRDYNFNIPDAIEVRPIDGHCLFDWIGIFESARELHCIDSCVANLIEGLGIGKFRRRLKLCKIGGDPRRTKLLLPIFEADWFLPDIQLPVAFFTIVYNGMPFIKHQLERFKALPFPWHWYIVEGLSNIAGDTGADGHRWRGGHIPKGIKGHLSTDGTKEYLDELTALSNVTIYRSNDVWPSKLVMINTPLPHIKYKCILWEIDVDEFYPHDSMVELYNMFVANPKKTAAILPHIAFKCKTKYIVSDGGTGRGFQAYARPWRYEPGYSWKSHEPPVLVNTVGQSLLQINPFHGKEVAHLGYHHYGYVHPAQIKFKESYYGYKGLYEGWLRMNDTKGKVDVFEYFGYDDIRGVIADDWKGEYLIPMDW